MKPIHLFTSMLALTTIVVTSCSAPRMAQQTNSDDDVYNTTATAKVYTPAPVVVAQNQPQEEPAYNEDDYYGTSDPYYDQDYSSRINRFYYSSPWRTYYDPYYYNGWNSDFGWGSYAGMGWGYMSSPFWGYNNFGWGLGLGWNSWGFNNWGFNNWGWNSYYGGGFLGGGYYGGGYYGGGLYGGGYYTGRTTNVPDYRSRPRVGREDGVGYNSRLSSPRASAVRTDANGNIIPGRSRSDRASDANAPSRVDRGTATRPARAETTRPQAQPQERPARTETARPSRTESRPTYTPPARTESSRGSSSSSGSGSSSRPSRAGRG